jgi:predicted Rossmann fold flavoprotein
VGLSLVSDGRTVYAEQGEMLFTHTGVSGPLVLSASAYMQDKNRYEIIVDLKPALDEKTLDARLLRDFGEKSNRDFINVLGGLLPSKLIVFVAEKTGISPDKKAHSITKEERTRLLDTLKSLKLTVKCKRPVEEAVITRGGVDVKQIDASTMQSKVCKGLYFAGEVIDVDALTGGYNLQIAFSTGYLAGVNC